MTLIIIPNGDASQIGVYIQSNFPFRKILTIDSYGGITDDETIIVNLGIEPSPLQENWLNNDPNVASWKVE